MITCVLTSLNTRCSFLNNVINSLLNQSKKVDNILLYYQCDSHDDINDSIKKLQNDIVKIIPVSYKYRSYSKYYYAIKNNIESDVILCDDDLEYNSNFVENLYNCSILNKNDVICNCYHSLQLINDSLTHKNSTSTNFIKSRLIKPLSGYGTYIPYGLIKNGITDIDYFIHNITTCDEFFLVYLFIKNNVKCTCCGKYKNFKSVYTSNIKFDNMLVKINSNKNILYNYGKLFWNYLKNNKIDLNSILNTI